MKYNEPIAYDAMWVYDEPRSLTQYLGGIATVGARKIKNVQFIKDIHEPPGYEEVIAVNSNGVNIEPDKPDYMSDLTKEVVRAEYVKKRARNVAIMGAWL